jgi:hypothetical protein
MKHKDGMIDNRMVNEDHQQGIERVKQRPGESGRIGQPGKMVSRGDKANWKRPNAATTPRGA